MSILTDLPGDLLQTILQCWICLYDKNLPSLDSAMTSSSCRAEFHAAVAMIPDLMREIGFPSKAHPVIHLSYIRWLVKRKVKMTQFCFNGTDGYDKLWGSFIRKEKWDLRSVDYVCFCVCPIVTALSSIELFENVSSIHFLNEPHPIIRPADSSDRYGLDDDALQAIVSCSTRANIAVVILGVFTAHPSLGFHILSLQSLMTIFNLTDIFRFEFSKNDNLQSDNVLATVTELFDAAEVTLCEEKYRAFNDITNEWEPYSRITIKFIDEAQDESEEEEDEKLDVITTVTEIASTVFGSSESHSDKVI